MTTAFRTRSTSAPAYRAGALALLVSVVVLGLALAFQYLGGYDPCPLCLMQRYAYYAGIPLLFAALVLTTSDHRLAAAFLFAIVAIGFLINAGLGAYHSGVEWKLWAGPSTCAARSADLSTSAGGLLKDLAQTHVVRCDEAQWRLLGLSFAGWNVVASLGICLLAVRAASTVRTRVLGE